METNRPSPDAIRIGEWWVEPRLNQIQREGVQRQLEPKVMRVLERLACQPGQVVPRDELIESVWSDVAVTDNVVARAVATLRKALEDDWRKPRYVQTISKAGYRLIAPVDAAAPVGPSASARPARDWKRHVTVGVLLIAAATLAVVTWNRRLPPPTATTGAPAASIPVTTSPGREVDAAASPDGSRVAFVRTGVNHDDLYDRSGWDIFVKPIGTEDTLQLTDTPGQDGGPGWSPDGNRIAYYHVENGVCDVLVVPASGGTASRVADCGARPNGRVIWSPDGRQLAFSHAPTPDAPRRLFLIDVASGESRALTDPPTTARGDQYPAFSSDGRSIAFARLFPDGRGDVHRVDQEAGEPRRLTRQNRMIVGLDWSRRGDRIVYSSSYGGFSLLWSVPGSGGKPSRLPISDRSVFWPTVSTGTDRLVYSLFQDDTNIWSVGLDPASPSGAAAVVTSTREDLQPSVSNDGERLAFVSTRSGSHEIWTSDIDGRQLSRKTRLGGPIVGMPRWSPDDRELVFDVRTPDGADLHVVDSRGHGARRLTRDVGDEMNASWSHDGRSIYFASARSGAWEIWSMPRAGGPASRVTRNGGFRAIETPDGSSLFYVKHTQPGIWQRTDGAPGERRLVDAPALFDWGNWGVTRDALWFVQRGKPSHFATYDLASGVIRKVLVPNSPPPHAMHSLSASPDGSRLFFTQIERSESDLMLIEQPRWE